MAENENEYERRGSCTMEPQGLIAIDGSVDPKGRPVLRSKTGRWKACSFLVEKGRNMELRKGMRVEVCCSEDGYGGAWFEGVILTVTKYGWRCKIRYDKFVTDDGNPLEEEAWLHSEVRPIPPYIQLPLQCSVGDAVEAYDTDCWWRGFIVKLLTGAEEELWVVYFPDTCTLKAYPHSDLRPAQEWLRGNWILAPQERSTVIERVIQYFALDNSEETHLAEKAMERKGDGLLSPRQLLLAEELLVKGRS